ncbi:glycosyltransferase [Leptolyngbya sp. 'hensonii']|uniref:glycosyltransferase n=1 Tax=Leptolyngbya sp. 'hensonii' TaxID=1922337 RepID=UPI00094F9132|nr:glycosyltransferase [Leptolyngbya sp. 'hensonii']OLP17164.1 glycosyltransferase [Leptolyngbya sp. 'hensonii']
MRQPHFYLLFPNIFGFMGGIQVYSAFLLQALQELYPEGQYDVFLKYDQSNQVNVQNLEFLPQTKFHYFGHHHGDPNPGRRYTQAFLAAAKIVGLALHQRPTLILTTHFDLYSIAFHGCSLLTGVPYWVVLHGLEAWNITNPLLKSALQSADRIVSVSTYTRDRTLQQLPTNPGNMVVLPNTFEADRFHIGPKPSYLLERYHLTPDQPVIFTLTRLGRGTSYKGYRQIIQALLQIRQHLPNVHYILAGKGDNRSAIEAMIQELGLQDYVTLPGFIAETELADHFNLCDVFAMPSKGEGFGIVYLQALACGKPVLAGNQDGAVDPLNQGELGCLVNPDDVDAIADNLIQILQGNFSNPLIYQPEILRLKTVEQFGFPRFRQNLADLLGAAGLVLP